MNWAQMLHARFIQGTSSRLWVVVMPSVMHVRPGVTLVGPQPETERSPEQSRRIDTRELISTQKASHKNNNKDLSCLK